MTANVTDDIAAGMAARHEGQSAVQAAAHKEAMAPHLRGHLTNAIEVCQDLLDRINNN